MFSMQGPIAAASFEKATSARPKLNFYERHGKDLKNCSHIRSTRVFSETQVLTTTRLQHNICTHPYTHARTHACTHARTNRTQAYSTQHACTHAHEKSTHARTYARMHCQYAHALTHALKHARIHDHRYARIQAYISYMQTDSYTVASTNDPSRRA